MTSVLDASAMIAFIRGEPGADAVDAVLSDPGNDCFAHAVNLSEVYYAITRDDDEATAESALAALSSAGVIACGDFDPDFCQEVGRLRARVRDEGLRVSLADCYCMAT